MQRSWRCRCRAALILTIAGGFLFGTWLGALVRGVSARRSAPRGIFLAARAGLGGLARRAGPLVARLEAGFRDDAFNYLLVLRLVPIFPFWLVNLVPAFVGVPVAHLCPRHRSRDRPGHLHLRQPRQRARRSSSAKPDLGDRACARACSARSSGSRCLALLPVGYKRWRRGTAGMSRALAARSLRHRRRLGGPAGRRRRGTAGRADGADRTRRRWAATASISAACRRSRCSRRRSARRFLARAARAFGVVHDRAADRFRRRRAITLPKSSPRSRRTIRSERFEGLGRDGHRAPRRASPARGRSRPATVEIRPRRFVIATGSHPAIPPIPGLDGVPYLTNETIFANRQAARPSDRDRRRTDRDRDGAGASPARRAGHGARCRPAPAARRSRAGRPPRRPARGRRDRLRASASRSPRSSATATGSRYASPTESGSSARTCWSPPAGARASKRSTSRRPASPPTPAGSPSMPGCAPRNRRAFAIGDVAGGPQFTHIALYHAGIVIRNALFRLPAKVDYRGVALGHLYRSRTRPGRADRGRGARRQAETCGSCAGPSPRTTGPRPSGRPRAWSRSSPRGSGRILGASILGPRGRRSDPALGTGDFAKAQDRRPGQSDRALPDARRGRANAPPAATIRRRCSRARTRRLVRFLARFG